MRKYKKGEIAKILNKKARTLEFYMDVGIVVPEFANSPGKGSPRLCSEANLVQFAMVDIMKTECGMTLKEIAQCFTEIKEGSPKFFGKKYPLTWRKNFRYNYGFKVLYMERIKSKALERFGLTPLFGG